MNKKYIMDSELKFQEFVILVINMVKIYKMDIKEISSILKVKPVVLNNMLKPKRLLSEEIYKSLYSSSRQFRGGCNFLKDIYNKEIEV